MAELTSVTEFDLRDGGGGGGWLTGQCQFLVDKLIQILRAESAGLSRAVCHWEDVVQ